MYALTKLCAASQAFVGNILNSGRSRTPVASIALARMISSSWTMPSAPVDDIELHYRNFAYMSASRDVSQVNEIVPLDIEYTLELCRAFYKYRYLNSHPTGTVFSFRENCLEDFFDISRAFSEETLKTIREEGADLAFLANGFRRMLAELNICPEPPQAINNDAVIG